jgi:hypothetical protein
MRLPDGSDRKRKVTELFGDISDIELEDLDSLENPCCKWETLMLWGTNLIREANKYYCEIQHKMSLYLFNYSIILCHMLCVFSVENYVRDQLIKSYNFSQKCYQKNSHFFLVMCFGSTLDQLALYVVSKNNGCLVASGDQISSAVV